MIKCISYWSVRDGLDGTRPIAEAAADAKAAGFEGIELCIGLEGLLTPDTDKATCESYRKTVEDAGLKLETLASGMTWGSSPTDLNPDVRAKAIEQHQKALQVAAWLGAKAFLMVPGAVKIAWDPSYGPVPYDKAVTWAREAVTQLVPTAEKLGVDLCLENVWNGLFYSPLEFAAFIDGFKSPRVGMYFDVGNTIGIHQAPHHWIEILGKRIRRIHIKDYDSNTGGMAGFCDLLVGDVPWAETMAALRKVGYDATIVAEMVPYNPGLLERTSEALDKILAM